MAEQPYALAIHGGAGVNPGRDYARVEADLKELVEAGAARLEAGEPAIDVVEWAVAAMEASGLYVAGRGSAPNSDGWVELDASIMDGARKRAGAVCAVRDAVNPIAVARAVMERTPHVLLAGEGATAFVRREGFEVVTDPADYYILPVGVEQADIDDETAAALTHGTIGAVALDRRGHLAAATSTGGTFGKLPGRVGDTPLPGIGTWADSDVAISCTGVGEYFILSGGAGDVAARMRYGGEDAATACQNMIENVGKLGGDGGVIAVDHNGRVHFAFNSPGLKRAATGSEIATIIAIY